MSTFEPINIEKARQMLQQDAAIFLDIRDDATFKQGHIPGAKNLSRAEFESFLNQQPKDKCYIVCCYRGNSSKQVAQILCDSGFNQVYNLEGGFTAWQEAANASSEYEVELDA